VLQFLVVLKIFTNEAAFRADKGMHSLPQVSGAVGAGALFFDNKDKAATCHFSGFVFPPYSLSEHEETLEVWLQVHRTPDVGAAVQVSCLVL
jgi:hypothetical protein